MTTSGAAYLIDGFKLIAKPGIRRYVIIPLLINIIIFSTLFYFSEHFFAEFNLWIEHHLPSWLRWIGYLLWIVFYIGFSLILIYTFVTISNLISAPFNAMLSQQVEFHLTGQKRERESMFATLKDIPRIVGRQLAIIGYYLPRAICCLILFFIPLVQLIAAPLWFVFNAWFMALQCIDYPTDNLHVPLITVKSKMKQQRFLSLTFGIAILICSMIPVVNFFVIPAAVAGATKLWLDKFK
jgi:CysZ protein